MRFFEWPRRANRKAEALKPYCPKRSCIGLMPLSSEQQIRLLAGTAAPSICEPPDQEPGTHLIWFSPAQNLMITAISLSFRLRPHSDILAETALFGQLFRTPSPNAMHFEPLSGCKTAFAPRLLGHYPHGCALSAYASDLCAKVPAGISVALLLWAECPSGGYDGLPVEGQFGGSLCGYTTC